MAYGLHIRLHASSVHKYNSRAVWIGRADAEGRLALHGPAPAGRAVDLRFEMDVIVALSNCPHPLDPAPAYAPQPVEATIHTPAPAAADDPCRGSPEAVRAFENTAGLHYG